MANTELDAAGQASGMHSPPGEMMINTPEEQSLASEAAVPAMRQGTATGIMRNTPEEQSLASEAAVPAIRKGTAAGILRNMRNMRETDHFSDHDHTMAASFDKLDHERSAEVDAAETGHVVQPYGGIHPFIFVSYAHRDNSRAMEIIELLFQASFRIWYDEGVEPGTDWDEFIAGRVESCEYFLALLTDTFLESSNCRDELNYARDLGKKIVLIYLDDILLPSGMRMRLGRSQAIYRSQCRSRGLLLNKIRSIENIEICSSQMDMNASAAVAAENRFSSETRHSHRAAGKVARLLGRRSHQPMGRGKVQRAICFLCALGLIFLLLVSRGVIPGALRTAWGTSAKNRMQNIRAESVGGGIVYLAAEESGAAFMPVERDGDSPALYMLEADTEYHFSNYSEFYDELDFAYAIDGERLTMTINGEAFERNGSRDARVTLYADAEDSFFIVDSESGALPVKVYLYQKKKLVLASEPVGGFQNVRFRSADEEALTFCSEPASAEDAISFQNVTGGLFRFQERYYVNRKEHAVYRKSNYGEVIGDVFFTYAGGSPLRLSSESQEINEKGPVVLPGERVQFTRVYFRYEGVDASAGTKVYKVVRGNEEFGWFEESAEYPFTD